MKIELENCQKSLTLKDFEEIESNLGYVLPKRLKEFYLKWNGGKPKQQTICINRYYEVEIMRFMALNTVEEKNLAQRSSDSNYINILIFAISWMGERIAVNITNGAIYGYPVVGFTEIEGAFVFGEPRLIADSTDDFFDNLVVKSALEDILPDAEECVMPELSDCSVPLTKEDIKDFEMELNIKIPAAMKNFYIKNGYIPALQAGEKETDPNVHHFEKRQPIAVTLGTSYDQWCLSRIADILGKKEDMLHYLRCSYNYRNVYNAETAFFHPKDKNGKWIEPFDYRYSGGQGAREYYGENNGWVYRWDVPHNVADLIDLMGGNELFISNLDQTFREPLGRGKYSFYAQLPDHTGNVGQFSMANEPSLHIPYLYNYAGQPWKAQKRIRQMLKTWFRNDLMGVPGDEDGGGMSAFVVFSSLGFYPVTPGFPAYNIGSPLFTEAKVTLNNGKVFEIEAQNASDENKYIQSATLNGKEWNKPWFSHDDIKDGGKLILIMGNRPNKSWGSANDAVPPSAEKL